MIVLHGRHAADISLENLLISEIPASSPPCDAAHAE